ncbi:hypothetical protein DRO29_00165 [Candidatus Bathyarchaeota archaeon]|nr:MAG: hypothetical protein B6U84_03770 [Candidatus Bathyarchaeota archaeon ex4484_40]RLG98753.1 MAG: hypothetical protein DRO29_00165 [Candidatus Bathyarchaeota archaeon]
MSYEERQITCPKCGYKFDILYARAFSCQGCPRLSSTLSCELIRCPNCDHEFPTPRNVVKAVQALKRWGLRRPTF